MTDIDKLIKRIDIYLEATEIARGSAKDLHRAYPLETNLYNIATRTKRDLEGFRAMLKDAQGTYLND